MTTDEQSLGLCSTCNSRAICTRRESIVFPVVFCEEFDDSVPRAAKGRTAPTNVDGPIPLDTAMGLCCNCGNRNSCTLQSLPGGVWHCEQYC
ncbi:MAG TPA: hypothetical protein ENN81_04425 [Phycisphaerales bacterium]|nr:hypothetical protein [Phycisphaerales bacterium]